MPSGGSVTALTGGRGVGGGSTGITALEAAFSAPPSNNPWGMAPGVSPFGMPAGQPSSFGPALGVQGNPSSGSPMFPNMTFGSPPLGSMGGQPSVNPSGLVAQGRPTGSITPGVPQVNQGLHSAPSAGMLGVPTSPYAPNFATLSPQQQQQYFIAQQQWLTQQQALLQQQMAGLHMGVAGPGQGTVGLHPASGGLGQVPSGQVMSTNGALITAGNPFAGQAGLVPAPKAPSGNTGKFDSSFAELSPIKAKTPSQTLPPPGAGNNPGAVLLTGPPVQGPTSFASSGNLQQSGMLLPGGMVQVQGQQGGNNPFGQGVGMNAYGQQVAYGNPTGFNPFMS